MKISKWLKRQATAFVIASATVEKNALSQDGKSLDEGVGQFKSHKEGMLSHDLMQGKVTQQVQELRWRMYRVIQESEDWKKIHSPKLNDKGELMYDEDGNVIVDTTTMGELRKRPLHTRVVADPFDDYKLEMIVNNEDITLSSSNIFEMFGTDGVDIPEHLGVREDDEVGEVKTIGEIKGKDLESHTKSEKPIIVYRELRSRFEIEKYAKKLYIRDIDGENKLLEFYLSRYPDEFDGKTRLLINEIKRAMDKPNMCDMLDIQEIGFISYNTAGVKDFHEYQYQILNFDKIVEHNEFFIIKFKAKVAVDGDDILEKYRNEVLDEKYKNKVKK